MEHETCVASCNLLRRVHTPFIAFPFSKHYIENFQIDTENGIFARQCSPDTRTYRQESSEQQDQQRIRLRRLKTGGFVITEPLLLNEILFTLSC